MKEYEHDYEYRIEITKTNSGETRYAPQWNSLVNVHGHYEWNGIDGVGANLGPKGVSRFELKSKAEEAIKKHYDKKYDKWLSEVIDTKHEPYKISFEERTYSDE